MPKLEHLKPETRTTIEKIAKASNRTPEEVLRIMLKPTNSHGVTTHLNYGV
jgi:hypothetical protein